MKLVIDNKPARPPEPLWDNIPGELTVRKCWVGWRYELVGERWTKVPCQPDGARASSTDPRTWDSFEFCQCSYFARDYDGIGFVLNGDGIAAIDLDHVIENGMIDQRTATWLRKLNSYTEISPSGHGLRLLLAGKLPPQDRRVGNVEMYDNLRFVSITGQRPARAPQGIEDRQAELLAFHSEVFAERIARRAKQCARPASAPATCDDAVLLERARRAANGARFVALYDRGDWKGCGFPSQSEADAWLCSRLMFWCCRDEARADRLFRASSLMRPKWNRSDYRGRTLAMAVA